MRIYNNHTWINIKIYRQTILLLLCADNPTVEDIKNFHQEISMMKSAGQHPNIVSLIGYCNLYDKPLLIVEYCSKGDLQTYLRTVSYVKENIVRIIQL